MFFVGLIVLGIYADVPDPPLTEPFKNKEFYGVWRPISNTVRPAGKITIAQTKISFEKNNSYEKCPYLLYNGSQDIVLQCKTYYPDGFAPQELMLIRLSLERPKYSNENIMLHVRFCETYSGAFFGITSQPYMKYSNCGGGYYYKESSPPSKPFTK